MYVMSSERCKNIDNETVKEFNIPSILLMENAASEVFSRIKEYEGRFTVICGVGYNGGDGLAIGRKLLQYNRDVHFILINPNEKYSDDCYTNLNIVRKLTDNIYYVKSKSQIKELQLIIKNSNVIIDAIFGIGLNRELNDFYKLIIESINNSKKQIISIDVPSGLDSNTGKPLGSSIKANLTYTFEVIKKGFIEYSSLEYLGQLKVISIGIPKQVKERNSEDIYILDESEYKKKMINRNVYGHKGTYGRAILFAGSMGFTGAAYITTQSCLKTGAGLTTLVTPEECQAILSSKLIEAMTTNFDDKENIKRLLENANSIAFGPGIKSNKENEENLLWIINNSKSNLVIDAEGINILGRRNDILKKLSGRAILTPHHGEMATLTGKSIDYVEKNRITLAKEVARDNNCVILLKGYNTIITDGKLVYINKTGNSKMATGGMGDCLTGIITSLLAQGYDLLNSALIGAYVHGKAAEEEGQDKCCVLASDVINKISKIINTLNI